MDEILKPEQFKKELLDGFFAWANRQQGATLLTWYGLLEEYATREFNLTYKSTVTKS